MKLLFLSPVSLLSKAQGTTLRIRGLARALSRRHEVSMLAFGEPPTESPPWIQSYTAVPTPRRSAMTRVLTFLSGRADLSGRNESDDFAAALRDVLDSRHFDAVIVEGLEMSPYLDLLKKLVLDAVLVYDAHNAEHILQRRAYDIARSHLAGLPAAFYSRVQSRRLARWEAHVCGQAGLVVCTSEPDRRALASLSPEIETVVVPNGIDSKAMAARKREELNDPSAAIVFVGKMDYRPNRDGSQWFAREVYPQVREGHPNTPFLIVGRNPTRSVRALGELSGVVVTGAVDDAHGYFLNAAVSVAPLRMGSGTRLKILEAMALGTPTVATTIGVEGLELERGEQILIADTTVDFARCVVSLLENPGRARQMGERGRRFVLDNYDWERLVSALESELEARV